MLLSRKTISIFIVLSLLYLSSCKVYRQHYMFEVEDEQSMALLKSTVQLAESNYMIRPNDRLELNVYTHKGEMLIDPEFELEGSNQNRGRENQRFRRDFAVLQDSTVKLPMVGHVMLTGMTIDEAETYLEEKYREYYVEPFVKLQFLNKRVIVLGAPGGQVIPLENENMNLIEVLALAGGVDENGKAQNVRLIRGELNNPEVYQIDLSTISGMQSGMTQIRSGDIIYVEPRVRIFNESLRDFGLFVGAIANIFTLLLVIENINN